MIGRRTFIKAASMASRTIGNAVRFSEDGLTTARALTLLVIALGVTAPHAIRYYGSGRVRT